MSLVTDYSGIVVAQNQSPETGTSYVTGTVYQDFTLPDDFVRGDGSSSAITPALTGIQFFVSLASTSPSIAWSLERYDFGTGWITEESGSVSEAVATGQQWITVFFDSELAIPDTWLDDTFRLKINVGTDYVYYATPNPLAPLRAYTNAGGSSPVLDASREVSLLFRVLGSVADEGTDFLGNRYRSAAIHTSVNDVATNIDGYWLSKPNPSRFAVENLYFDVRDIDLPAVIDRVLVDPVTPGVFFHVYYSTEGVDPSGYTPDDWDDLLWTRVPHTFQATRRETHALPQPITARFVKIEFSHLQARPYAQGDTAVPIEYRKHPKWVLDYFLLRAERDNVSDDPFVARNVAVTFDALDLAYNYYLDDLRQEPDAPVLLGTDGDTVKSFLTQRNDVSDYLDIATYSRIRTTFSQFSEHPALFAKLDYLPSLYSVAQAYADLYVYPAERDLPSMTFDSRVVSQVNRDPVLYEQSFPVMFFFIQCRHQYRKVVASLTHGRAYFVGIREIRFDREQYTSEVDSAAYIERLDDTANTSRDDFLRSRPHNTIARTPV